MDARELEPGIVSPELNAPAFTVGGVTYTRTQTLTLARGRLLERYLIELQFNASLRGVVSTYAKAKAELNAGKWADGLFTFGLMGEKLDLIGANRLVQAEIVGLFYNAPGEDPGAFVYEQFSQKVYTAWGAVDRDFFMLQALRLLNDTGSHYPPAPVPEATLQQPG